MHRCLPKLLSLVLPLLLLFGCSENKKSEVENKNLMEINNKLDKKIDSLIETNKELSQKNEENEDQITSLKNEFEEIKGKITQLKEDKTALEENLENLKAEIEALQSEVDLKNSSAIYNQNSNTIDNQTILGDGDEYFANCTELRGTYPHGVPSDHPAYQDKMDRDHDGYACER